VRSTDRSTGRQTTRRAFLAGVAGAGVGSGCLARASDVDRDAVSVLAAGSLANALENGLRPRLDAPLQVESRGSAQLARQVSEGQKDPDVVAVADEALFESPLEPAWHALFATNAVVLAYNPETEGGRRLADADEWYRPLLDGGVTVGRTDPDLDPLGYRTLFALELATDHYGTDADLRAAIPGEDQVYPETQLLGQLETGSIDAAFAYRNMAVERDYAYVDLPPPVDLSDPGLGGRYETATYELPDRTVLTGAPIRYAATVRRPSETVSGVFEAFLGTSLEAFGFSVPESYPRYTDDAPDRFAD